MAQVVLPKKQQCKKGHLPRTKVTKEVPQASSPAEPHRASLNDSGLENRSMSSHFGGGERGGRAPW
jgi:hypothetical protein